MFQPFILHITCLWFAGTLAKPKHVGNAFTYLNLTKRLLTVTLSSGYHTFQDILHLIYFHLISITFLLFSTKRRKLEYIQVSLIKAMSSIYLHSINTQRATNENVPTANFFETDFNFLRNFMETLKFLAMFLSLLEELILVSDTMVVCVLVDILWRIHGKT